MAADFARAVTDYWAEQPGELSCSTNDIIKILRREGRKLVLGENLIRGESGLLPTYCFSPLELPDSPNVFFALDDFIGTESGDLSFTKGTVILGDKAVDGSWWSGWVGRNYGIFPIEWARRFPAKEEEFRQKSVDSSDFQSPRELPYQTTLSQSDGFFSKESAESEKREDFDFSRPHGRALYEFDSGISGELKLVPGDLVVLRGVVDDNWLEGELSSGQQGIFPSAFLEILVDLPRTGSENFGKDCPVLEDFPPFTYAIVTSSHAADSAEELSLEEGDTVTILSRRGFDWIQAMDDFGNVGVCPTRCLEIIGSEPDEVRSLSQMDDLSVSSFDSFKRSDGSLSPTLSGEMDSLAFLAAENKRTSWHNDRRLSPTILNRGRHTSLQHRPAKRNLKPDEGRHTDTQKRHKIGQEIVATEKDYLTGLKVCLSTMLNGPSPPKDFQMGGALQNLEGVLLCSESLLHDLCVAEVSDGQIGECFLRHIVALRSAYVTYCQNSDTTIESLAKAKDVPELSDYMDGKVAAIRLAGVNCFDLAGMFIKPLQRILKYPLLMSELLKVTGSNHSDHVFVVDSLKLLTEIAVSINELKRRKELVVKYRSLGSSWADRLSRISFHSIAKKSSRLSLLVSSTMGFTTLIQDPAFQTEERKFQVSKRTIKWFLRSVTDFISQVQVLESLLIALANDHLALTRQSNPSESVPSFVKAQNAVAGHIRDEFIPKIDLHVIQPLEQVLKQYQGPSNLITKRHAKLIDYENAKRKVERTKNELRTQTILEELELAKKVYQALNAQLLEDLPKFNHVICRILKSRVDAFLHFRKICCFVCSNEITTCCPTLTTTDSTKAVTHKLRAALMDLKKLDFGASLSLPVFAHSAQNISQTGSPASNESLKKISTQEMQADVRTTCSSPVRNRLMRSATLPPVPFAAPPGSQFRVISDYRPGKNMDLAAHRGELVEVIKKQDPMGSDQRWFVRRNGEQGFLPKEILVPAITSRLPAPAPPPPVPWRRTTETNETEDGSESTLHENSRLAGFDFLPNGPHQLPLTVGDEVSVLSQHDLDGNSEWWYVQNRHGTRGYVPSAYLKKPT